MKKTFFLLFLVSFALAGCLTQTKPTNQNQLTNTDKTDGENQIGLSNPASVYCAEQGGRLEIRTDTEGGQTGFCVFEDNSECEEWSYFRNECQPQSEVEDISAEVKQLFIQKYNKNQDEVIVTVSQQTADYARGGVKFGIDGIGEGGIFLAAKVDDKWQLVFDGNGMISCSQLEGYDFPETMITDCFDY